MSAARLFRVDGMVAVVTGGGSGLGSIIAKTLAANGASKVYIIGRNVANLEECSAAAKGIIVPIQGDISSKKDLENAAKQVETEMGYINLFVANSGTFGPATFAHPGAGIGDLVKTLWDVPMEEFTSASALNVTATFYSILAFLELLDAGNKKGNLGPEIQSQVIINGSSAGYCKRNFFPYATSKAASVHLGKMLSTLLVPYKIRVNSLSAGLFNTGLSAPFTNMMRYTAPEGQEFDFSPLPIGRLGTDEDLAGSILYLASRAGGMVSGSSLVTDGGHLSIAPGTI